MYRLIPSIALLAAAISARAIEAPFTTNFGGLSVTDQYFFIQTVTNTHKAYGSPELWRASQEKSSRRVVHNSQVFGFRTFFQPVFKKLRLHVQLNVPSHPENFPVHDGKLTIKESTILVDDVADGAEGTVAFYWGIAGKDPRGRYRLSYSIDDSEVVSYDFVVE